VIAPLFVIALSQLSLSSFSAHAAFSRTLFTLHFELIEFCHLSSVVPVVPWPFPIHPPKIKDSKTRIAAAPVTTTMLKASQVARPSSCGRNMKQTANNVPLVITHVPEFSRYKMKRGKLCNVALGLTLLLSLCSVLPVTTACQVCSAISLTSVLKRDSSRGFLSHGLGFAAMKGFVEKRPVAFAGVIVAHRVLRRQKYRHYHGIGFRSDQQRTSTDDDTSSDGDSAEEDTEKTESTSKESGLSSAMILSIGFYKNFISPLLPPACRFLPTCSQYGVQAISEFGPSKGGILIAWRLLRCSPIGGKGYDPPKWPPVPFTYSSY
jgi:putative membrane protein insertion efficiency factor